MNNRILENNNIFAIKGGKNNLVKPYTIRVREILTIDKISSNR